MNITSKITKGAGTFNEVIRTVKPARISDVTGTSFRGTVEATFDELREMFGNPYGPSGDGKVRNEWILDIDGVIVTIYDYKEDLDTGKTEKWHVGGKSPLALELVQSIVNA